MSARIKLYYEYIFVFCEQIKYRKTYTDQYEDNTRLMLYMKNRKMIAEHNRQFELGLSPFSLAINQFGDMVSIPSPLLFSFMDSDFCYRNLNN